MDFIPLGKKTLKKPLKVETVSNVETLVKLLRAK